MDNIEGVVISRSNQVFPDPRVEKTAQTLAESGRKVMVIGWDRSAALPHFQECSGFQRYLISLPARFGSGMANIIPLLRWQFHLLFWLFQNRNAYHVIHACDFDTVLPACCMRFLFHKHVVYDIFDFYADHLRSTPRLLLEFIRWLDFKIINWVDAVIVVDDARLSQIDKTNPHQIAVIYNTPQDVLEKISFEDNNLSKQNFRLAYVGLLQVERGILTIFKILQKHPDWILDMAGFGGDEDEILDYARNLPNVIWHGRVSYERALEIESRADVLFATYDPSIPNHRYSSPNKVFEAMMLSKPILVSAHTHMDLLVDQQKCGLIVQYGDIEELERSILLLHQDPSLRHRLGNNGRTAYEIIYDWRKMSERLLKLYSNI